MTRKKTARGFKNIQRVLWLILTVSLVKEVKTVRRGGMYDDYGKMTARERQEYAEKLDKEISDLMTEMNDIEAGLEKDFGGKIDMLQMANTGKKEKNGQNLDLNFAEILKYISEKEPRERERDYIMCGLKLIMDTWNSKLYEDLVYKIITNYGKEIKNSEGKIPFRSCEFKFRELSSMKKIFGLFFEPERLLTGKDNLRLMAKLLIYLANERRIFLFKSIYTLHTLSNLFWVDIDLDFYYMENQITKLYGQNKKNLYFNQIVNNQISKCSYSRYFFNKVGFSYSDLFVVERLKNPENGQIIPKTGDIEEEADQIIDNFEGGIGEEQDSKVTYGVQKFSLNKNSKSDYGVREIKGIMKDYHWHLNYPIPTENEYTHKENDKLCLKCKNSILLVAQHLSNVVGKFQQFLDIEESEYLITEKTRFFQNKTEKENLKQNRSDYLALLEQMAARGENEAALELAQEYYYGNDEMGIPRNENIANQFYREAADRGDPWAVANYALMKFNCKKNFLK